MHLVASPTSRPHREMHVDPTTTHQFSNSSATARASHISTDIHTSSRAKMQTSTGELIRRRCSGRPHHGDEYLATPSPTPGIQFCHPAYDDLSCALFWIPGHDSLDHGLHHETARLICGLIADNRSGWFTTERDGKRIDTPQDGLLKLEQYYFRVSDDYAGIQYLSFSKFSCL